MSNYYESQVSRVRRNPLTGNPFGEAKPIYKTVNGFLPLETEFSTNSLDTYYASLGRVTSTNDLVGFFGNMADETYTKAFRFLNNIVSIALLPVPNTDYYNYIHVELKGTQPKKYVMSNRQIHGPTAEPQEELNRLLSLNAELPGSDPASRIELYNMASALLDEQGIGAHLFVNTGRWIHAIHMNPLTGKTNSRVSNVWAFDDGTSGYSLAMLNFPD